MAIQRNYASALGVRDGDYSAYPVVDCASGQLVGGQGFLSWVE